MKKSPYQAVIAFPCAAELGEGAIWDAERDVLYWVDILGATVHLFEPTTGTERTYDVGRSVATVVPCVDGSLLLGLRDGIARLKLDTGEITRLCDPEPSKPHTRLNDGKCDPAGRFWVGSICEREPQFDGALWCFDTERRLEKKLDRIQCSNGLVWSRDQSTFYYIDTPTSEVWAFDYDVETATLGSRRTAVRIDSRLGCPDGMAIDDEDHLYVAMFGGGRVLRLDPVAGKVELQISVPTTQVTSVAFGGTDLRTLYITTARVGQKNASLEERQLAGSLFSVELPYRGVKAVPFGGFR